MDQFGVDIEKPDQTGWGDLDKEGKLDYIFAAYTVNGSTKTLDKYEIDIYDSLFISIVINQSSSYPNDQPGQDYFTITLSS